MDQNHEILHTKMMIRHLNLKIYFSRINFFAKNLIDIENNLNRFVTNQSPSQDISDSVTKYCLIILQYESRSL